MFSVSVGLRSGFHRSSSLVLPLLSGTGCSVCKLTSNAESCDEDDGEVGEGAVEEDSLMNQEPQMVHNWMYCNQFSSYLMRCGFFDHWSNGQKTHNPHRASRERELREFLQEALLDKQVQSLICTVASSFVSTSPLAVTTVVDFSISSRFPVRLC